MISQCKRNILNKFELNAAYEFYIKFFHLFNKVLNFAADKYAKISKKFMKIAIMSTFFLKFGNFKTLLLQESHLASSLIQKNRFYPPQVPASSTKTAIQLKKIASKSSNTTNNVFKMHF